MYKKKGEGNVMLTIVVKVDSELKQEATELFNSLGLDMSTAIKLFLVQFVKTQGIPFKIKRVSISDEAFQKMIEKKYQWLNISVSDESSLVDFFGDEDFSEYEEVFNDRMFRFILFW